MDLALTDKVVFVAGSSRGIGRGIASVFMDEGAKVMLSGRSGDDLERTCRELSAGRTERVASFAGDLSDAEMALAAHRAIVDRWGKVDVLVCNVGSGTGPGGWQLTVEDWNRVFQINLWATVRLVEVFLPGMAEVRSGNILFISSIAGHESLGAPLPYSAAKAALEKYSKDLSHKVAKTGVRVNCIAPGNILFPGGTWQQKLDKDAKGVNTMIERDVPAGRFGTPEEIGAAAAFLASERASFINGASLVVDGGQTRA